MNILYLSCHSILEYQEVKLFTELGHNVLSLGAYQNPAQPQDVKRPPINGFYDDALQAIAIQTSKENLHPELIEWADWIVVMHREDWITGNWDKFGRKKVVWRTIGQSIPDIEARMSLPKAMGMKIVRYSPEEATMENYAGQDAMIRFYADPQEYCGYTGEINKVMTVAQSMKKRDKYCGYDIMQSASEGYGRVVFGPGNEEIDFQGGLLSYAELKEAYRKHRVYFYTGTYPASYTLNFMEAMMTGIPIVAIGRKLADLKIFPGMDCYEVDKIIQNGVNGFVSDDIDELRIKIGFLLDNPVVAKKIGEAGRKTAIELFGKEKIKQQWKEFFATL